MSYLDVPRLHLSGAFYTDPSTVDNDPTHYSPAVTNPSPWQEPEGLHHFRILDCAVVSVQDDQGVLRTDDPAVGATVSSLDTPVPAKLVDIDVYQQSATTVYGMQLKLVLPDGSTLEGRCDRPTLIDAWFNAVLPERSWAAGTYGTDNPGGDGNAAGAFQCVIRFALSQFTSDLASPAMAALKQMGDIVDGDVLLSFHFTLDAYIIGADTPILPPGETPAPGVRYRRYGRFAGVIGPWRSGEPLSAAGPRRLYGRGFDTSGSTTVPWFVPSANDCNFVVDAERGLLSIDLSIALCRTRIGGGPADYGTLTAYANPAGGAPVLIGELPYTSNFDLASSMCTIPVPPEAMAALQTSPLTIVASRTDILGPTIWSEPPGPLVTCDTRALRMTSEPGSSALTATVDTWVRQFGAPVRNYQLAVVVRPCYQGTPGLTVPPSAPGNTSTSEGALTANIASTDSNGHTSLVLSVVKDPGSRTPQLDSQLYFVYPCVPDTDPVPAVPQESQVSVVVWASYPVLETPQWSDIQPMMVPYDKLFPGMRNKIRLTDEFSFYVFMNNPPWFPVYQQDPHYNVNGVARGAIGWMLTRSDDDPWKMPVSRDLNPNKVTTILNFVKSNPVEPTPPPGPRAAPPAASTGGHP